MRQTSVLLLGVGVVLGLLGRTRCCPRHAYALVPLLYALIYAWAYATTLLSPRACILLDNETVIEQPVALQNLTLRLTQHAVHYIEHTSTPFVLYVPYHKVHTALFTSPAFEGHSRQSEYGDNIEELDWSVGQLLRALERRALLNKYALPHT